MENQTETTNVWETKKLEIQARVSFLSANCFFKDEFYIAYNKLKSVEDDTVQEEKLLREFEKTALLLKTFPEFKYALSLVGISDDTVRDVAEHENAHLNKAEELGATDMTYGIGFMKDANVEKVLVFSWHKDAKDWSEEQNININKQITEAPELYGNKLSSSDKEKLKDY